MLISEKFQNDTQSVTTNVVPIILIQKQDFNIGVSTQQFTLQNNDVDIFFEPLLLNIPRIYEKTDIKDRRYTISSVNISLSNIEYLGIRLSDSFANLINSEVSIYYKTQSCQSVQDCLKVYSGKVISVKYNETKLDLSIEDASQAKISKEIPLNQIPDENYIDEDFRLTPIPIVYGFVDKSPLAKYAKNINVINDSNLDEYAQKVYFLADNIESDITQDTVNIHGYENTVTPRVKYNFGSSPGSDDRYVTPLIIFDGGYANIVNFEPNLNEDESINSVFIENKVLYIEKKYETDNTPLNPPAGLNQDEQKETLEATAKAELYNPVAFNPQMEVDNNGNSSNPGFPDIATRIFNRCTLNNYVYDVDQNNEIYRDLILQENLLGDQPGEVYAPIDFIFDPNRRVNFEAELRIGSVNAGTGDYYTDGRHFSFFTLMCNVKDPKVKSFRSTAFVTYRGFIKVKDENLEFSYPQYPFRVIFGNTGLQTSAIMFNSPNLDMSQGQPLEERPDFLSLGKAGLIKSQITRGGYDNLEDLESSMNIQQFAMMITPFHGNLTDDIFFNTDAEGIETSVSFDNLEINYHFVMQDFNLIQTRDFYASVYGRASNNLLYHRDFYAVIKSTLYEDFYNNFDFSGYGTYYYDNNIDVFKMVVNDNYTEIQVKPIEMTFSKVNPRDFTNLSSESDIVEDNYVGFSFKGILDDVSFNEQLDYVHEFTILFKNGQELSFFIDQNEVGDELLYVEPGVIDFKHLELPGEILYDLVEKECNYESEIIQDDIEEIDLNYNNWKFAFTQNQNIPAHILIEDFCKSSKSFARFGLDNKFILNTIKDNYTNDDIDKTIVVDDIISYKYDKSPLKDVKTLVKVKYNYDYGNKKYNSETNDITVSNLSLPQDISGYDYNYYNLNENDEDSTLIFKSSYIRDELTANNLRDWLLSWYMNQHNYIHLDLNLSYADLELNDIVVFDKLINNMLLYGEDYTQTVFRNGQEILPYFMVVELTKSVEKVSLKLVQLHKHDLDYFPSTFVYENYIQPDFVDIEEEEEEEEGSDILIGDANFDGVLNYFDIQKIINIVMGSEPYPDAGSDLFIACDVNNDGAVDMNDIVALMDIVLR